MKRLSRIAALDIGDVRIGVAVCDETQMTVNPVSTYTRTGSIKADVRAIEELLNELNASIVVIGNPLDKDEKVGAQAQKVKEFADRLSRRLRIEVVMWDERYTTSDALEMLIEHDVSRKKRKEVVDQAAAVLILESYLQEKRS